MEIEVRDRDGSFSPQVVRLRQRRLDGIDQIVLSLTVRGLTTGEVAAQFEEVFGAKVSKDTISKITVKVIEEMTEWRNRQLTGSTRSYSSTHRGQGRRRAGHQPVGPNGGHVCGQQQAMVLRAVRQSQLGAPSARPL